MIEVLVRDVTNNRVHLRYRREGERALYSREDEHDSSGAYVVLTDAEVPEVEAGDLCRHCFPRKEDA